MHACNVASLNYLGQLLWAAIFCTAGKACRDDLTVHKHCRVGRLYNYVVVQTCNNTKKVSQNYKPYDEINYV